MASQVSRPIYNADDITPFKKRWTVLIQVMLRRTPRDSRSKNNPIKFRSYLVTDMQGILIGMVTYGNDVPFFDATLVPFRRYYISNAFVKKVKPGYEVGDYPYTWTLNNSTIVEPVIDAHIYQLPCRFEFTPFSEFAPLAERETCIAIRALVVKLFSWKIVKDGLEAKEYVIVDNENIPILLRTWRNTGSEVALELGYTLPEPLFIIATNVCVTAYHGLSLTTRYSTVCLQDPPTQDAVTLKAWYNENAYAVSEKLGLETYRDVSTLIKLPSPEVILPIDHVINSISEGAIKLVPDQQNFWYTCCSNCNKSVRGDVGWSIWCEACKENTYIELRYNFEVSVEDGTSTICVTLYAADAEKLLPFTITELEEETSQGKDVEPKIRTAIGGKQIVCFIKHFDKPTRDIPVRKYPVIRMFHHNEVFAANAPNAASSAPNNPESEAAEVIPYIADKIVGSPAEKEFFSPATKHTLEEIAAACDMPLTQSSPAKRGITFESESSVTSSSAALLSTDKSDVAAFVEPKTATSEGGPKKQRTKVKIN